MDSLKHIHNKTQHCSEPCRAVFFYSEQKPVHFLRLLATSSLGLVLICGWLEQHFTMHTAILGAYLLVYPHLARAFAVLVGNRLSSQAVGRGLMYSDSLHLGVVIGLTGFPLVLAIGYTGLLVFYTLLRRTGRQVLPVLSLTAAGSSVAALLETPLALEMPLLTTGLCLASLVMQLALVGRLLRIEHEKSEKIQHDMQIAHERHQHLARDLARYLSPQVWQMVFSKSRAASTSIRTERKKLTIFFSDIKGFTELSEEMEPEDLTETLNGYLSEMTAIALKHGGTVDKFIGDSIMVFFGDSQSRGASHDALAAVAMAIEMRKHMRTLRRRWAAKGIHKRLEIRMGINTGYCTVGTFGAESRMDYTIIGREVNLASRLESAADAGEILVSGETYTLIKDKIMGRDKGQIQVKGIARPVSIYQIIDFRRDLGPSRSYLAEELPGFSMQLDAANLALEDIDQVIAALNEALGQLQD